MLGMLACQKEEGNQEEARKEGYVPQEVTLTTNLLSPEILNTLGRIGNIVVSPDQKTVLYTVTYPHIDDNKMYKDIYSIPVEGGEPLRLTNTAAGESNVVWRPDGKKIGFISKGQIWEMNPDGTEVTQVSDFEKKISGFNYSPDLQHIYYFQEVDFGDKVVSKYPHLDKSNAHLATDMMYRHWDHWVESYSHIFIAPYGNQMKEGKDIMEGEKWEAPVRPFGGIEQVVWLPDSKTLSYVSRKKMGTEYANSTNTDVYFYHLETEKTTNMTEGMMGYDKGHTFSPDGKMMAWESMERDGYESDKTRLFVMDLASGEKKEYSQDFDQNTHGIAWNHDSQSLFFISDKHATDEIYQLTLADGKISKLTEGIHNYKSVAVAENQLIASRESMSKPRELYRVNPQTGEAQELSFINKNVLDQLKMGEVTQRWVTTTDNKQMLVWLVLPPNFDENKKYPTLLYCQGGPQGTVSQFWSYRWNFQLMAANGYIVVAPNRRGLPGFGQEWLEQISGDYGGQNMKDYLSAIDNASQEPYVDEDRLGAIGASYGGYSVFWLAGNHQKRFKTFIAHAGIFNFEAMYLSTEEMFFVNWDMGGAYWEKNNAIAQRTYASSPHNFVEKWDTPIFVIHGEKDFRIPYTQGMQAFQAARQRGIPAKYLDFPEENHWILGVQNSMVWQYEFYEWLDKWLK